MNDVNCLQWGEGQALPLFFVCDSVPEPVETLEMGNDNVVMGYDHDGSVELFGNGGEQFDDDQ